MTVESAVYISQLNASLPAGADAKAEGDNHLRLIKAVLVGSFPNVSGAVTATHTEINYLVGVTSGIQTQINAKGAITGQAWTGTHTFVTQAAFDNSTKAATTAYVDQRAMSTALPTQTGFAGGMATSDGTSASWTDYVANVTATSVSMVQGVVYRLSNVASTNCIFPSSPTESGRDIEIIAANDLLTNTFDLNGKELVGPFGTLSGSGHVLDRLMRYRFRYVGGKWRV